MLAIKGFNISEPGGSHGHEVLAPLFSAYRLVRAVSWPVLSLEIPSSNRYNMVSILL